MKSTIFQKTCESLIQIHWAVLKLQEFKKKKKKNVYERQHFLRTPCKTLKHWIDHGEEFFSIRITQNMIFYDLPKIISILETEKLYEKQ